MDILSQFDALAAFCGVINSLSLSTPLNYVASSFHAYHYTGILL